MDATIDTIVIGAGQAGLATGYELAQLGLDFEILDAHEELGAAWRERWDGLRLFTPARMDGLPGMDFPAPPSHCPTKDEVADFLALYARRMQLPVRLGTAVERLTTGSGPRFRLETRQGVVGAERVIVASGAWHEPRIPSFARELRDEVEQLHSSAFRQASQLAPGPVLVVGGANSGAEIAALAAGEHETTLAGRDTGQAPYDIEGRLAGPMDSVIWFLANHVLTVRNPIGRRAIPSLRDHGTPLERVRKPDLAAAGVERVYERVVGVRDGLPLLEDGEVRDVKTVIWATGFRHDYPWIELSEPVVGEDGWPLQDRGVSTRVDGLFFVGLPFQTSMASALIGGVGRDARTVARQVAADAARDAQPAWAPATGR